MPSRRPSQNHTRAAARQYWVGIVGAPASGKTTTTREVARRLREAKGIAAAVIPM